MVNNLISEMIVQRAVAILGEDKGGVQIPKVVVGLGLGLEKLSAVGIRTP